MNTLSISWENYFKDIDIMIKKLKLDPDVGYNIVALSRGGLIPATILSHKINSDVYCLGIKSYNKHESTIIDVYQDLNDDIMGLDNVIIIDDLVDSGKTLEHINEHYFHNCIIGCVYNKSYNNKLTKELNLIVGQNINFPCWIKFPYECE